MAESSPTSEFPGPSLKPIAHEVMGLLKQRKETVCVAETAAGGLISAALLSLPGASAVYKGGLTIYTLESRLAYCGWTQEDIDGYKGPTSALVAGLARHTRDTLGADYAIGESGTAGPTGGSLGVRKVGTVTLAVATAQNEFTRQIDTGLGGDREGNMVAFAVAALTLLRDVLKGDVQPEQKL